MHTLSPSQISKLLASEFGTTDITRAPLSSNVPIHASSSWSQRRLMEVKKKRSRRIQRTAMGEYIPTENKDPLTAAAIPLPSGFDYRPNSQWVQTSTPKVSIARRISGPNKLPTPSPTTYDTSRKFYQPHRAITMKSRKGFTFLPKAKSYQNAGPETYNLPTTLGVCRGKALITSRPPENVNVGMLPSFQHPMPGSLNQVGFYPAPEDQERGIPFGIKHREFKMDNTPSPIYNVPPIFPEGRKFSIRKRLPWPPKLAGSDTPSPNTYYPKSELGTGGRYPSVTPRLPSVIQGNKDCPSPNRFSVTLPETKIPITIGTIPLPSRFPRQPLPSPNSYSIEPEAKRKHVRGPLITNRRPMMLQLRHASVPNKPPPSIHLCYFKYEKFGAGKPSAQIRSRLKEKQDDKMAPNAYYNVTNPSNRRTIPAYTFSKKKSIEKFPLTINVQAVPLPSTLKTKKRFTFGSPHSYAITSDSPAPSRYIVRPSMTRKGKTTIRVPTFKSRPSPFIHHGLAK